MTVTELRRCDGCGDNPAAYELDNRYICVNCLLAADDSVKVREELIELSAAVVACHTGDLISMTAVNRSALLLAFAVTYGINGWAVFPLNGKVPAIPNPHPKGSPERRTCHGGCGQHGHGVLDAATDLTTICQWWAGDHVGANIGGRIPNGVILIDNDPRVEGHAAAAAKLNAEYGLPPTTLTHRSGRGDGGRHRFYRRPAGKLSTKLLGPGFDVKADGGYCVLPPSVHPDSGRRYFEEVAADIADCGWLADLIVVAPQPQPAARPFARPARFGESLADAFCEHSAWADILGPHGWECPGGDPDGDGAVWLHPTHTSSCSATVSDGRLYVYSSNTPFEPTSAGDPRGYSRFAAHAVLNFGGDMKAAAAAIKGEDGRRDQDQ